MVNAVRGAGIAYNNLGLPRDAIAKYDEVAQLQQVKDDLVWWGQHLAGDRFSATSKLPRFRMSDLQRLYDETMHRSGGTMTESVSIMMQTRLANCYISAGNFAKASRLLDPLADEIIHGSGLGSLHRVIFMNTFTRLSTACGDSSSVAYWHTRSKMLAHSAGLLHQERSLELTFAPCLKDEMG